MTEATRLPADLAGALALIAMIKDRADRNETARREAVALWTKQAEHCRQMVADLAISRDQTDRAERISSDRLNLLKAAQVTQDAAIAEAWRLVAVEERLTDLMTAAQGVIDAWNEPERPYIGERMDILGTTLGYKQVKP